MTKVDRAKGDSSGSGKVDRILSLVGSNTSVGLTTGLFLALLTAYNLKLAHFSEQRTTIPTKEITRRPPFAPCRPGLVYYKGRCYRSYAALEKKWNVGDTITDVTPSPPPLPPPALAYDIPRSMARDEENFVRLYASIQETVDQLEKDLRETPAGKQDDYGGVTASSVAKTITAKLDCDKGTDECSLTDGQETKEIDSERLEWEWRVRPLAFGDHLFTLTVTANTLQNGKRIFQKPVHIPVTLKALAGMATTNLYASIPALVTVGWLGTIVSKMVAYVRKRRAKTKQNADFQAPL